jgi:hypothetical protein
VTYAFYDDSNNRIASKTLALADGSGNIKYEYYNEDYNGTGIGRIYKTTASDGTVYTNEGYYSGTPLKARM